MSKKHRDPIPLDSSNVVPLPGGDSAADIAARHRDEKATYRYELGRALAREAERDGAVVAKVGGVLLLDVPGVAPMPLVASAPALRHQLKVWAQGPITDLSGVTREFVERMAARAHDVTTQAVMSAGLGPTGPYVRTRTPSGQVLRVDSEGIRNVLNGYDGYYNAHGVSYEPFDFDPTVSDRTGVRLLHTQVARYLPLSAPQRYLAVIWGLTAFLSGLVDGLKVLLRFGGGYGSAKTSSATLIGKAVIGHRFEVDQIATTSPALLRVADRDGLAILDNTGGVAGKHKTALISAATGGARGKAAAYGSVTHERYNALIGTTSLGAMYSPDVMSRMIEVTCKTELHQDRFDRAQVLRGIALTRDEMLSGLFRVFEALLTDLETRTDHARAVIVPHRGVGDRRRLLSHVSLMGALHQLMSAAWPDWDTTPDETLAAWGELLFAQHESDTRNSPMVSALADIVDAVAAGAKHELRPLSIVVEGPGHIVFTGRSRDLYAAMNRARQPGAKPWFSSPQHVGIWLNNHAGRLEAAGWRVRKERRRHARNVTIWTVESIPASEVE